MTPQLWVFAGPNGAGKSTFVERYVAGRIPVLNPDNIARQLPGGSDAQRMIGAGRIAVAERQRLIAEHESFVTETTLSGKSELELMRTARTAGYKINLIYIGLGDVAYSIGRVRSRVESGGHEVPLVDLLRRFSRSLGNLPTAMALADRVLLFDNSGTRRQLLLSQEQDRLKFRATTPPQWALPLLHT